MQLLDKPGRRETLSIILSTFDQGLIIAGAYGARAPIVELLVASKSIL